MQPAIDVFVGKKVDWHSFEENPEFFTKFFDLRYTASGIHIMRKKNGNGKRKASMDECRSLW